MTDLIKFLRTSTSSAYNKVAADLIEELSERLTAATDDAKEAEAYAEELEDKLATCEKYSDAYAEFDRIGTQAVRDLEAKLTKAVEALRKIGKTYSADGFRLIHSDRQIINMVYIVLAELEGEK